MNVRIRDLYYDETPISEISNLLQLDYLHVTRSLKDSGVLLRRPPLDLSKVGPDWLHDQYWEKFRSLTSIGKQLGVTAATVMAWMESFGIPRRPRGSTSSRLTNSKVDVHKVRFIRQLHAQGVKQKEIREILERDMGTKLSKSAISKIVLGQTWRDVS